MAATCPICSKDAAPSAPDRSPRAPRSRTPGSRAPKAATGLKVRRMERAPDDGYDNWLVHGLRASADAVRLADELAFSEARLAELREDPPGLYAEVARSDDRDEAAWLAFEIAVIAPGRGGDAWSALEAARVPWATDVVPEHDAEVFTAYRAWAQRHGTQMEALSGEPDWDPIRRFGRTFERLAIRGLQRSPRFDFLVTLGALGLAALEAGSLMLTSSKPSDPVVLAAKRIMGIG